MAARVRYPQPSCTRCGHERTFVKNTMYTDVGEILRLRVCPMCDWKIWTLQAAEETIDTNKYQIRIPTWREPGAKKKPIQVVPLSSHETNR